MEDGSWDGGEYWGKFCCFKERWSGGVYVVLLKTLLFPVMRLHAAAKKQKVGSVSYIKK